MLNVERDGRTYTPHGLQRGKRSGACSTSHDKYGGRPDHAGGLRGFALQTGGAHVSMTENERRNADVLTREDVIVRGFSVVALVSLFLMILLML
jgi:hypothetical protein